MTLRVVNKIIVHGRNQRFNFFTKLKPLKVWTTRLVRCPMQCTPITMERDYALIEWSHQMLALEK